MFDGWKFAAWKLRCMNMDGLSEIVGVKAQLLTLLSLTRYQTAKRGILGKMEMLIRVLKLQLVGVKIFTGC
jgi:hypothetical protein